MREREKMFCCELDMCFEKERAYISRLAEMRHFWHELVNVALYSEAVTAHFCNTVGSAYGEKILGERKGDFKE